jgi:phosphate-selective porin OprO/OprP
LRRSLVLAAVLFVPVPVASAQPAPAPADTKVDASRGGLTISSGVNSLTIGARAQVRWTLDAREDASADTTGTGVGEEDGAISSFDVPRLRLTLSGGAFRPWLKYSFQFELSRTGCEGGSRIKDAVLEIRPVGRSFRFQAGQFKAPFGLQQLTSSGRLQFVDRAITDNKFNPGRDMGAMFSGTLATRRAGYDLGVFNGSGESIRQANDTHLLVGRVYLQPIGAYALAETSVDAPEKPVLHLGAAIRSGKQIRGRTAPGIVEDPDNQTAMNLEFAFKGPRLYSTAEYFWMTDEQENPSEGRDIDSRGFHAQAGYMVVPKQVDVGLLYARITPDTEVDDAATSELRGVFGYFWQAHGLKLQADVGALEYESQFSTLSARARQGLTLLGARTSTGAFRDTQVRVQLQLAF